MCICVHQCKGMELKNVNQVPNVVNNLVKALDSKVFKALTEPARAEILKFLMLNGRSDISTIAESLPLSNGALRHQRRTGIQCPHWLITAEVLAAGSIRNV